MDAFREAAARQGKTVGEATEDLLFDGFRQQRSHQPHRPATMIEFPDNSKRKPWQRFLPAFLLTPIGEQPPEMPKPDDGEEVTDLGDIAAEDRCARASDG
jgi:hypothetical protein